MHRVLVHHLQPCPHRPVRAERIRRPPIDPHPGARRRGRRCL